MFWGLTPALDLIKEYQKETDSSQVPDSLNILIVGSTDCRHVLTTLARRYRHEEVILNFYLVETCMETVAKQLLLLLTGLQSGESMGLDQKTKVFMEIYGNTLVRPYTAKYLTNTANDMVKMITNYDYLREKIDFIKLEIKYKERDYLENIVKFWCGKDDFNIMDCWDRRLRKNLGFRYDSKIGAFDWDLHMRMHTVGGKQVCNQEYRAFRLNGIAFSWIESEVSRPNRSLVCGIFPNGENFLHYGYLGDMQTGPFVTYGLESEDESYLKSTNGQNAYRSTDVTERNLKQIFFEIEHQKEYEHTKTNDLQLGCAMIKQDKLVVDIKALNIGSKITNSCIKVNGVQVNILSKSVFDNIKHKSQYNSFFDIVYYANNYMNSFERDTVEAVAKDHGLLLVEHQLFVLSHRKKDLEDYANMVQEKVSGFCTSNRSFEVEKDCYFRYILKKNK